MGWIGLDMLSQTRPIPRSPDGDKNCVFRALFSADLPWLSIEKSDQRVQDKHVSVLLSFTMAFYATRVSGDSVLQSLH